jgi:tripartite-type tricarboxylate transporter receptor subunit TctC
MVLAVSMLVGVFGIAATSATAADINPETYFKGKTINLIVDFKPGGGTDLHARHFAQTWGKFIPGNPNITVRNIAPNPAGRNYVWKSKPDGLTVSFLAAPGIGTEFTDASAEFESDKFEYIGAHTGRDLILLVRDTVPYKTLKDAKGGKVVLTMGETVGRPEDITGKVLASSLMAYWMDAPMKILPIAQAGTADSLIMLERGDINTFVGGAIWYTLPRMREGWFKKGFLKPIADLSNPDIKLVSNGETELELENAMNWLTPEQKGIWEGLVLPEVLSGKALATTQKTPPVVVKILRDSYEKAFKDAEFAAGVEKIQREPITLITGEDMQKSVIRLHAAFKKHLPEYKKYQQLIYDRYVGGK